MRALWSQLEEAWRDTLVHRGEGGAFRRLGTLFGLEHPEAEIPERHWRGALHTLAYGRRGTFQDTYTALQYAFAGDNITFAGTVDSSDPTLILADDPANWGAADDFVNRLIKVDGQLLFTVARSGGQMRVAPARTLFWDAPVWSHIGSKEVEITILPFVAHIRQPGRIPGGDAFTVGEACLLEIIYFALDQSTIPVTYLVDPSDYGTPGAGEGDPPVAIGQVETPVGIPVRGQALLDETVPGYPDTNGPYPLYAYDGSVYPAATRQLSRTMAASVELRVSFNPPL